VSIAKPVAAFVVAGLAVAAVQMLALDPQANDGAATFVAAFGVPMVVVALSIQLVMHNTLHNRRTRFGFVWWPLVVLPLGILALSVPSILASPDYFEATDAGGIAAALGIHLMLILFGTLFGALLWFFIVMPSWQLVLTFVRIARREPHAAVGLIMPSVLLALGVFILLGAGALDLTGALPGRFAAPQIVLALLGLPGNYGVQSPLLLWLMRGLLLAIVLVFVVPWWLDRRASRARRTADVAE
jgi:hypothetical protein